jgi:hypothetical protein
MLSAGIVLVENTSLAASQIWSAPAHLAKTYFSKSYGTRKKAKINETSVNSQQSAIRRPEAGFGASSPPLDFRTEGRGPTRWPWQYP